MGELQIYSEGYLTDEDKVAAYGTYSGTYKATRKYFEARVTHLWKLQKGIIVSFWYQRAKSRRR